MESVLSSHWAFYYGVSAFFSFGFLLRRVSVKEPFSSMESVLVFVYVILCFFRPLYFSLFQACTAIANGMPIVTQLPASWYTHPCHTHNGWVFKVMPDFSEQPADAF